MTNSGTRPQEVADFYDGSSRLIAELNGGSLHFGCWDSLPADAGMDRASQRLTEMMTERIEVGPGQRVLDIGCGTGAPAVQLARATGAEVVGITISPEQVRLATAHAEREGVAERVTFRCADASAELPFPADSFDAVWFFESIFHLPDRLTALRRAAEVLRPGGRLALTDVLHNDETSPAAQESLDEHAYTPLVGEPMRLSDYPPLLRQARLVPVECRDISELTVGRTLECMHRTLDENRERFVERYGSELVDQFSTAVPLLDAVEFGYGIVTAARPDH
ncbi:SAM-dependent methyltransferase [Streptomyces nogalater]|uniref:SAM-dependent methyltransferase n=1 Tax=Streptomyces nogalater TaxID=38314 RepID=Q9EYI2_STRNO|nr:SnogM [Streptomyces nogalater]